MIELKNISKGYTEDQAALIDINLTVNRLSRLGIVGETGSGKSTLLRLIAGLEQPDTGAVIFNSERVLGPQEKLVSGHKEIAYLSQYFNLPKFITVAQYLDNAYELSDEESDRINQACQIEHLLQKDTQELSGGEKQRVSFAKSLTQSPTALLLDEPFSNLDFIHKRVIKGVIESIEKELGTTVIMVAHDPRDILGWAEQVLVLKNGEVVQMTSAQKTYDDPKNEYVAGLFGSYNLVDPSYWNIESSSRKTGEKIIVRPEQFQISTNENGMPGIVEKVLFQGSYDELMIQIQNTKVTVLASVNSYRKGDKINLLIHK